MHYYLTPTRNRGFKMRQLKINEILELNEEKTREISRLVFEEHSKDVHYLAFDRQLTGFSPLGSFLTKNEKIRENENKIMEIFLEKKEVCSLYPLEFLTLFPIELLNNNEYRIIYDNIDKDFKDILELNDKTYKTKYLYVDFGHGANNFDEELLFKYLRKLLEMSKILEAIYIEQ